MTKILVLGDSHTGCFKMANENFSYTIVEVGGATAYGSINLKSRTSALKIFEKKLKDLPRHDYVCTQLGEVDCGFIIWALSKRKKTSLEEQLVRSLDNYVNFLSNIINKHYNNDRIMVLSTPLPTVEDHVDRKFFKEPLRAEVTASLKQRTDLTIEFNRRLGLLCEKKGYTWIDITNETIDESTGTVDKKWKNSNPYDHHLNLDLTKNLYEKKITDFFNQTEAVRGDQQSSI